MQHSWLGKCNILEPAQWLSREQDSDAVIINYVSTEHCGNATCSSSSSSRVQHVDQAWMSGLEALGARRLKPSEARGTRPLLNS